MPEPFDMNAIAAEVRSELPDLGVPPAEPLQDPPDTGEVAAPPTAESPPEPSTPAPAANPWDTPLTKEQWDTWSAYQQLDERLRTDTEFAQRFRQAFDPVQPVAVQPPPPDPSDRYVDPEVKALQDEIRQIRESQQMIQAANLRQQQIENQAQLDRATESFKTTHNLDDTQMTAVIAEAQKYAGALQTLFSQGVDQQTALTQVFSAAYWNMPDMQTLELDRRLSAMDADKTRKAKASSLSSGSGSAPRTAEGPKTEQQRRDAMTRDLAEVFTGATN